MRFASILLALLALPIACAGGGGREALRVCADPNNLPFSNSAGQGFENRIVQLVAAELDADVSYTWWAQRRGNVRETLKAGRCDVIPGVGAGLEMLATTRPYYNSTYVAVSRGDRNLAIRSFDDPRLRNLRIGVQLVGDDFSNTPPAHALARRGLIGNVRGYMIYGDYGRAAPQAAIMRAVASGEVDVAFVWGPVAGFFARRSPVPLTLTPLPPTDERSDQPMAFAVAMGIRRREPELRARLEQALERRAPEIRRLLAAYSVPTVASAPRAEDDD
jgi:mxaJ protein